MFHAHVKLLIFMHAHVPYAAFDSYRLYGIHSMGADILDKPGNIDFRTIFALDRVTGDVRFEYISLNFSAITQLNS